MKLTQHYRPLHSSFVTHYLWRERPPHISTVCEYPSYIQVVKVLVASEIPTKQFDVTPYTKKNSRYKHKQQRKVSQAHAVAQWHKA